MTELRKTYATIKQHNKTTQKSDTVYTYNTASYSPHLLLKLFQNFLNNIVYELCLHNIYYFILFLIKNTKYFSIRNSNAIGTDLKKICNSVPYRYTIVGSFLPARKQTGVGKISTCVLYYTNKHIFLLGKNQFIYCSNFEQLLTIPARCGGKQQQVMLAPKRFKKM